MKSNSRNISFQTLRGAKSFLLTFIVLILPIFSINNMVLFNSGSTGQIQAIENTHVHGDLPNIDHRFVDNSEIAAPPYKIFMPLVMNGKPVTYQTVPFGQYVNPYFELTFDTSKWKAGPLRLGNKGYYHLFSLNYPKCYIDDLWEHGFDSNSFYPVDSYETHANISFHFQIYYRTGTSNPAFSIIKWGPGEKYVIQIDSVDSINSEWTCFNEGKEVLWLSAERGFN